MSVDRQFPSKTTFDSIRELCQMPRKDRVAKYQADMRDVFEDQLMAARSTIVAKYRSAPNVYPDGIDTPLHRWYVASDWADDGTFIGPLAPAMNGAEAKAREAEKARKLAAGRAALAEVEAKLGVKPYQIPPIDSLTSDGETLSNMSNTEDVRQQVLDKPMSAEEKLKFDKAAYQRAYMQKKRLEAKATKPE